jgi:Xaa-Pro aminopeptidase
MTTNEKIKKLRELMSQHNLDAFFVNTADAHQSEYISDYFKTRVWLTGFDGSAGYALVTKDAALLWADGRYFIQAAKQIEGSEFKLMKIDTEGFPTLKEYLMDNLPQGGRLGFDGRIVSQGAFEEIAHYLKKKDIELVTNLDLVGDIWADRPALPKAKAWLHDLKFTGLTAAEKLANVRAKMAKGAYDLIEEGLMREIVSKVQNMRKEAGFEVLDKIKLYYEAGPEITAVLSAHGENISTDVLALEILPLEGRSGTTWDINGHPATFLVEKVVCGNA